MIFDRCGADRRSIPGRKDEVHVKIQLPALLFAFLLLVAIFEPTSSVSALDLPRIIPHSAPINRPVPDVFKILKAYFSDHVDSKFALISADEKTDTIVAKQTGIDSARWSQWAACQTDPMHLIYQLNDAMVTLTIKLDKSPHDTTFMTVSADFQGVYGLAQDSTTIECKSTGTLEDNILTLAGAQMSGTQSAATSTAPGH
jgi:hypothetical protein